MTQEMSFEPVQHFMVLEFVVLNCMRLLSQVHQGRKDSHRFVFFLNYLDHRLSVCFFYF